MNNRIGMTRKAAAALAGGLVTAAVWAQTAAPLTNGTVMDATGTVMVQRGATSVRAGRGTSLQPGDRVFVLDDSSVTFACPGQDAVKVTAVGTVTYGGCRQQALATLPPEPGATGAATGTATPGAAGGTASTVAGSPAPGAGATGATGGATGSVLPAPSPPTPPPVVAASGHGAGTTLGIIGGLAVLAAAGGGGGGGSKPASP